MIAGPTASGKSGAALSVAERIGGTIVNMDALQVYSDLRVLTARPAQTEEERVPHRLFGHVDAAANYDVAHWLAEARQALAGGPSILVGGTGLYLSAALRGLAPVPPINPHVRTEVRGRGRDENRAELERLDPAMAARLRPSDSQRIARALEVVRSTGRSLTEWQATRSGALIGSRQVTGVILDPPRDRLTKAIEQRLMSMFAQGAVEEVRTLDARPDVSDDAPVWRAIGARPIADWLTGTLAREQAFDQAVAATRAYAKRQRTWFRHQAPADWLRVSTPDEAVDSLCAALAESGP